MRDVAAHAHVSLKTVSRVVNDEPGVSRTLTERVRASVAALEFRPNTVASSLRRLGGGTATVGLLLPDVANPFSATLHRAVEDVAMTNAVLVFSASSDENPQRERELVTTLTAHRVDGLVIAPAGDDQRYLEPERRAGTVIVCVDRVAANLDVDSVIVTNLSGSTDGVRHLIAAGHRRIAFLGDHPRIFTAAERYRGYRRALTEAGLPIDPDLVIHGLCDEAAAEGAVTRVLARPDPPTALFTAQNLVTIGATKALHQLNRHRQVALVGFDDVRMADLVAPGITVVAQDPTAIGRTAASVLFRRLAGDLSPPTVHVIPTSLVQRGSGEIPPP
jgi:LacI family transcriptional regulator